VIKPSARIAREVGVLIFITNYQEDALMNDSVESGAW
jgi:hypothetical protein